MKETDKERIGRVIARIPSGCGVLAAGTQESGLGMLASWFQQCSFDPPMITVAVKKGRPIEAILDDTRRFVLNLIGEDIAPMFRHFGKGFAPNERAFDGLAARPDPHGVILADCIGYLSCEVVAKYPAGDHQVYVGEVVAGRITDDARPYVHLRKNGLDY